MAKKPAKRPAKDRHGVTREEDDRSMQRFAWVAATVVAIAGFGKIQNMIADHRQDEPQTPDIEFTVSYSPQAASMAPAPAPTPAPVAAKAQDKPQAQPEPQQAQPAPQAVAEAAKAAPPAEVIKTSAKVSSPVPKLVSSKGGSETYKVGEHTVTLKPDVVVAFNKTELRSGLPKELLVAACARESGCDATEVNADTKACGLFQLMPTKKDQTLFRLTYNYSASYGYGYAKDYVVRYNVETDKKKPPVYHYKPKDAESGKKLASLCLNADFNTSMFVAEKEREIASYEKWLGNRKITMGEIIVMNNLGLEGLKAFAQKAWDDKKNGTVTMARDHFGDKVSSQNPSLVKYPDTRIRDKNGRVVQIIKGEEKSVRQSFNDIINGFGGWSTPGAVLTASLN